MTRTHRVKSIGVESTDDGISASATSGAPAWTNVVAASCPRSLRPAVRFARGLLFDHAYFTPFLWLVLLGELLLGYMIIRRVAYTEIDWIAYMEEVKGFLDGEWDYAQLKGQTGPLVYPAGFVYVYSVLYYLTDRGTNILRAQYLFLALYLAFIAVVLKIYHQARVCPPWVFLLLCASRRIHSIFLLRCFNDCFALFFLYIAIDLMQRRRWTWACVWFSLALSIKMNILLFMPALGILLLQRFGVWRTIPRLFLIVAIQLVLAIPFLLVHPWNYFRCAFAFDRAFFYIWTVNLKILSEEIFLSPELARGLLIAHIVLMFLFLHKMLHGGLTRFVRDQAHSLVTFASAPSRLNHPSAAYILVLMFIMNLIGVVCARSLHYQFYVWYYHSLPLLLYMTPLPNALRLGLLLAVEYAWNVFPATALSSGILIASHLILLIAFLAASRLPPPPNTALREQTHAHTPAKKAQ